MKDGNSDKQDVFLSYRTDVDSLILKYGSHETYLFVNGYSGKKRKLCRSYNKEYVLIG